MAKRPSKNLPKFSDRGVPVSTRPAMPWATTPGQYLSGKEALDAADHLGVTLERYWGVGRLRLLVDGPLREKYDRQKYLFHQARWEGTLEDVKRESARMIKAHQALDTAAKALGASPVDDSVWELSVPQGIFKGTVIAIAKNEEAVDKVRADGRHTIVYTLEEIGRLISYDSFSLQVKTVFEGAEIVPATKVVEPIKPSLSIDTDGIPDISAPIDSVIGFDWTIGDDPPF